MLPRQILEQKEVPDIAQAFDVVDEKSLLISESARRRKHEIAAKGMTLHFQLIQFEPLAEPDVHQAKLKL